MKRKTEKFSVVVEYTISYVHESHLKDMRKEALNGAFDVVGADYVEKDDACYSYSLKRGRARALEARK